LVNNILFALIYHACISRFSDKDVYDYFSNTCFFKKQDSLSFDDIDELKLRNKQNFDDEETSYSR